MGTALQPLNEMQSFTKIQLCQNEVTHQQCEGRGVRKDHMDH